MSQIFLLVDLQKVAGQCSLFHYDDPAKAEAYIAGVIKADSEQAAPKFKAQLEETIYEQMSAADKAALANGTIPDGVDEQGNAKFKPVPSLSARADAAIAAMPPLTYRRCLDEVMSHPGGRANFAIIPVQQG